MSNRFKWRARVVALALPEFLIQVAVGVWQGACEGCGSIRDAWRKDVGQ
jgi:hypothetical protein